MKPSARILPSIQELNERFILDAEKGSLVYKTRVGRVKAGTVAGHSRGGGYSSVYINGHDYMMHRVVWAMHFGEWPEKHVDHKNGVKTDNRVSNLRLASRSENLRNSKRRKDNKSGHKGVCWSNRGSGWCAQIVMDGRNKHLGYFSDIEDAVVAWKTAAQALHGDFYNDGSTTSLPDGAA